MFRKHEMIPSRAMDRRVHLWRYGHFGMPLLVFPSAAGMAHEWDSHGMVDALSELIGRGKIKLYCSESNVSEAWTRRDSDPVWRMQRHHAFERYVVQELAPWIRADCRSDDIPIAVSGVSLGAYYSVNFALKNPEIFRWALCMSGRYNVEWLTDGFHSQDIYFNNPMAYVPNLAGEALERVRRHTHVVLVCGQGYWERGNIEDTNSLAGILASKGISHEHDMWGADTDHEWPAWRKQSLYHLSKSFG